MWGTKPRRIGPGEIQEKSLDGWMCWWMWKFSKLRSSWEIRERGEAFVLQKRIRTDGYWFSWGIYSTKKGRMEEKHVCRNFSQASSHEEICGCLVPSFGAMVLDFMFVKVLLFLPLSTITAETRFGMVRSYQMLPIISILFHSHQWPLIKDDASNSYAESRPNGNSWKKTYLFPYLFFQKVPIFQCWIFPGCI